MGVGAEGGAGGVGGNVGGGTENEGAESEVVEHFAAVAPDVGGAVFPNTLVVEAVDGSDLPRLVVATDERDAVGVSDFEAEEKQEGFQRVEATVNEVPHEEVVGVRHVAAHSEELHQVVELAVYVPAYCDWGVDCDDIAFFYQQLACLVA